MKIIEMMVQFVLRAAEMFLRFFLDILLALLKGAGKILQGFLTGFAGGFKNARGRQPQKQHKPRRRRRKVWARRHRRA